MYYLRHMIENYDNSTTITIQAFLLSSQRRSLHHISTGDLILGY